MQMERGFRGKLGDHLDVSLPIQIRLTVIGGAVYDSCCFGVDASGKMSDDRYMIFYNQTGSPAQEITYSVQEQASVYDVKLTALPDKIEKLVFTASIDGDGRMGEIRSHTIQVIQNGNTVMEVSLTGQDFKDEKAIIGLELYKKDVWRIAVVARGFDGGLEELLKMYGGELASEEPKAVPPVSAASPAPAAPVHAAAPVPPAESEEQAFANKIMGKISLSKDKQNLEKHVVNLSKCVVDLSKKSGVDLGNARAKVVVVLDYSGSMTGLYSKGVVQQTINKLVPLGLTFDDNGSYRYIPFSEQFPQNDGP